MHNVWLRRAKDSYNKSKQEVVYMLKDGMYPLYMHYAYCLYIVLPLHNHHFFVFVSKLISLIVKSKLWKCLYNTSDCIIDLFYLYLYYTRTLYNPKNTLLSFSSIYNLLVVSCHDARLQFFCYVLFCSISISACNCILSV